MEGQLARESSSSQEHSPVQSCQSFPESVHSDAFTTVSERIRRNDKLFAHLQIRRSASSTPVAGEDHAPSTETSEPQSRLTHTALTDNKAFAVPFEIELMLLTSWDHAPYEVGGRASRMVPQTFVAMIHPNTSYSNLQDILKQSYDDPFLKGNPNYPRVEFWKPYSSLSVLLPRYTRPSYEPPDVFQPSYDSTKTSCSRVVVTKENCATVLNLLKRRKGQDVIIVHVCVMK